MKCDYIIKGVSHKQINHGKTSSYFVLRKEHPAGNQEFEELLARLVFPSADMERYLNAIRERDFRDELCILMCPEAKYGLVRSFVDGLLVLESEGEELVPFFIREDGQHIGVSGEPEKFINVLQHIMSKNPALKDIYDYLPAPDSWQIPRRINLKWLAYDFGLDYVENDVRLAATNLEDISDDVLALLYINQVADAPKSEFSFEQIQPPVEKELEFRLAKGLNPLGKIYDFREVTIEELNARGLRALWNLRELEKQFTKPSYGEDYFEEVHRYLQRFSDDELTELTMVGFYAGKFEKELLIAVGARFPERS